MFTFFFSAIVWIAFSQSTVRDMPAGHSDQKWINSQLSGKNQCYGLSYTKVGEIKFSGKVFAINGKTYLIDPADGRALGVLEKPSDSNEYGINTDPNLLRHINRNFHNKEAQGDLVLREGRYYDGNGVVWDKVSSLEAVYHYPDGAVLDVILDIALFNDISFTLKDGKAYCPVKFVRDEAGTNESHETIRYVPTGEYDEKRIKGFNVNNREIEKRIKTGEMDNSYYQYVGTYNYSSSTAGKVLQAATGGFVDGLADANSDSIIIETTMRGAFLGAFSDEDIMEGMLKGAVKGAVAGVVVSGTPSAVSQGYEVYDAHKRDDIDPHNAGYTYYTYPSTDTAPSAENCDNPGNSEKLTFIEQHAKGDSQSQELLEALRKLSDELDAKESNQIPLTPSERSIKEKIDKLYQKVLKDTESPPK